MAKLPIPKFNLRLPKAQIETLISLVFRYRGKRLVYSTGYSIHPKDWNFKTQRPIAQERRSELFLITQKLDALATLCTSIFIESDYGAITIAEFKLQLDQKAKKITAPKSLPRKQKSKKKKPPFFEFIEQELQEMKSHMKVASLKPFVLHARILKEFGLQYGGKRLFTYEDVDWNFRLQLIDWLIERNVQLAYGNKTLKILKQFLERAKRKKLHSNTDYQGKGWTVPRAKAKGDMIVFTLDELQRLADIKFSGHLAKIRDICLIGAGTGQRYGDFSRLELDHFSTTASGISLLSIISSKTNMPTKVPLNIFPWLIPILERNGYRTPKMSMQKFNDGLKELAELVAFNERTLIVEQYMGRKPSIKTYYVPKYEVVSSHICRRSFATNLYRMGYRLAQIMPMTGHATESQLRDYIGIDVEQNAEEIGLMVMQQKKQKSSGRLRSA